MMSDYLAPIESVKIDCDDKYNLINYDWLFENVPWMNHDNKVLVAHFQEPQEVLLSNDGTVISRVKFDHVLISALHSFAGNSYAYHFHLGSNQPVIVNDTTFIGFAEDEIIEQARKKYSNQLRIHINGANKAIENILKLEETTPSKAIVDYINNLEEWEELNDSEAAIVKSVIEIENIKPFETSTSLHVWEERYNVDDDVIRYIGGVGLKGFSVERLKKKDNEQG